jgi:hypothetical protein
MRDRTFRTAGIVLLTATAVAAASAPVLAEIAKLTSVPLGKGTATISWTGTYGNRPTIGPISGSARGLSIKATGVVLRVPSIGNTGQSSTSVSIPSSVPVADVKGTIGGTSFTLDIALNLTNLNLNSNAAQTFGTVTGSLHGREIQATLSSSLSSSHTQFSGTIGADHVMGTIGRVVHHGNRTTAYATFDVTK